MLSDLLKVTQLRRLYGRDSNPGSLAPETMRLLLHVRGAGRGWESGGAEGVQSLSPLGAPGGGAPPGAVGEGAAGAFGGPASHSHFLSPHSTKAEAEAQRR